MPVSFTSMVNGKSFQKEGTNEVWSFIKDTDKLKISNGETEQETYYDVLDFDGYVHIEIGIFNEQLHFQIVSTTDGYSFKISGRNTHEEYGIFTEIKKA